MFYFMSPSLPIVSMTIYIGYYPCTIINGVMLVIGKTNTQTGFEDFCLTNKYNTYQWMNLKHLYAILLVSSLSN
jgi:hypothetical protein